MKIYKLVVFYLACVIVILSTVSCVKLEVREVMLKKPLDIEIGQDAKPVQFKRIIFKLPRGQEIGEYGVGMACEKRGSLIWKGGRHKIQRVNISSDDLTEIFIDEFENAGYPVVGNPEVLFEEPTELKTEYIIGGMINEVEVNLCYPLIGVPFSGNPRDVKGGAYLKVHWQLYSTFNKRVLYETHTEGSYQETDAADLLEDIFFKAFSVATQNLLADEKFHELIVRNSEIIN